MGAVEELEAQVATHVRAICGTAASVPAGGGPAWDQLLAHYQLRGFGPDERTSVARALGMTRGATPGEVNVALESLARWAQGEVNRLATDPALAAHPRLRALAQDLPAMPARETEVYERSVGLVRAPMPPPAAAPGAAPMPALGNIFANAQSTSKEVPWANMQYKQTAVLTCVHCGGPQEVAQDFLCRFCRRPIAGRLEGHAGG